jgi:hypothetical protein
MESQIVATKDKDGKDGKDGDAAERKAQLIRKGEFYRVGVVHAKAQVKHAARPEVMFHSAIDHATWALRSRVDSLLTPSGASVSTLLPYALTIFKFIRGRRMGKKSLAVGLVLAGAGFYLQQRRARQAM